MNILLTGSNGFIGSYFKKTYADGYHIDTFSFLTSNLDKINLLHIDTIVHLSALVHQMGSVDQKIYEKINVTQTLALANKAKGSGVKHFIFMSTVKVYGGETDRIYTENSPCNPQDDYGKSKLKAEQELQKLENDTFKVSIIRTPIVYGKGVKANIANLVKLVRKMPVLPFANIQNRRSMVYIGNLSAIIDQVIKSGKSGIFLASDDESVSTTELILTIAEARNKKIFLLSIPFFPLFLKKVKPSYYQRLYGSLEIDNTYTKEILNFANIYSMKEGIEFMISEDK